MICSLRFKKDVFILKKLFWLLCFWFWSYTPSKLVVISSYCSIFCATSASFLAYVGGVLVTTLFTLLLIEQIITHEEHLRYTFLSVAIFWTAAEALHGHNNRKWLNSLKAIFTKQFLTSDLVLLLWCMLWTTTPDISASNKKIKSTARVSRLSFRFL